MKKSLLLMLLLFALAALPVCAEDAAEVTVSVPALPQELQNRTVLVSLGSSPADWPEAGMARLHALGFKTAAMALDSRAVSIDDPALRAEERLAIVLGTIFGALPGVSATMAVALGLTFTYTMSPVPAIV